MPRTGTIFLAVMLSALAFAAPRRHASVHALKGKLGSVRQKRQAVRAKLHETRVEAQAVKRILVSVDDRLTDVQAKLASTQRDLGGARRDQTAAVSELALASAELAKTRLRARARLRAIAKQGDANVLVAFVSAKSVGDLAERKDLMERIARRDHELFERMRRQQREVAARKRAHDATVFRVARLASRERAQQSDLRNVRAEKGAVLQGLKRKETDFEETLSQFDDDERAIRRLIALANLPARRPGHTPVPAFIGRFLKPVDARITSGFGMRYHPILHVARLHAGVDFGTPVGTPVRSAGPGEVVAATSMKGFGNVVIVDHGGGVSTVYGHLSRIEVRQGERLAQGQVLGASGNSGLSTGPHLHWEVHVGGHAVNPLGRF